MKKVCIYCMVAVILLMSCADEPDETELDIVFSTQPTGGLMTTILTCVVAGTIYDEDDIQPITADIYWYGSETATGAGVILFSDQYTFDGPDGITETVDVYLAAPAGYYFLGYFWVVVEWYNEDGTYQEAVSNRAYCYE